MTQRHATVAFVLLAIFNVVLFLTAPFAGSVFVRWAVSFFLLYVALRRTRRAFGWLVALAMAFGVIGDLALAPLSRATFSLGVAAFLIGHVFYIAAFGRRGFASAPWKHLLAAPVAIGAVVLSVLVLGRLAGREPTPLLGGVLVYDAVLLAMSLVAIYRAPRSLRIALGAVIFFISDAHIAVNFMLRDVPLRSLLVSGLILYMLGQYLLVFGAWQESDELHGSVASQEGGESLSPARS
jgi:alkenylglycerophosphocholine hydrolase